MPTAKKAETIEALRKRITAAPHMFFTDYAGLTVEDTTKLRGALRGGGTSYAIVKNTLFARAAGAELAAQIEPFLKGPTAVVFSGVDPVAPAKALRDFADESKKLTIKAAFIEGRLIDAKQIAALAAMPSKVQLQTQLVGLLVSPLRGLVTVLAGNQSGFVRVLDGIRQKKVELAAAAPSSEPAAAAPSAETSVEGSAPGAASKTAVAAPDAASPAQPQAEAPQASETPESAAAPEAPPADAPAQ